MGEDTVERELFGGAMRMAIPPRFQVGALRCGACAHQGVGPVGV